MSSSSTEPLTVALDLDGTLTDPRPRQVAVMAALTEDETGAAAFRADEFWAAKREGMTSRDALIAQDVAPALAAALAGRWAEIVEDARWLELDRLLPGVEVALEEMADAGIRMPIVTARVDEDRVREQISSLGLDRWCDEVRVVDPGAAAEQKAAALGSLGARFFVGDTESDAAAARRAAVGFVAVSSGQRSREFLAAQGIPAVDSLAEALRIATAA